MLFGLKRSGRQNWQEIYFAPNTDIITGGLKQADVAKAAQHSVSFLFPHELYTGIIPVISGVGNVPALTKLNKATVRWPVQRSQGSLRIGTRAAP